VQSRLQRWVIASDTQATGHLVSPPLIGPLALAQCSRARREAALRAACRKRSRLTGSWIVVWHGRAQRCSHCLKWASADRLAEQSKRVHAHPHPEIAGIQFAAPLALQATVTSSGQSSLASRVARSCELRADRARDAESFRGLAGEALARWRSSRACVFFDGPVQNYFASQLCSQGRTNQNAATQRSAGIRDRCDAGSDPPRIREPTTISQRPQKPVTLCFHAFG